MKKPLLFFTFGLLLSAFPSFGADLDTLYSVAATEEDKIALFKDLLKNPGSAPPEFWTRGLRDLLTRQVDRGDPWELSLKMQLALVLLDGLGATPPVDAAPLLWKLFEEASDPQVKGRALVVVAGIPDESHGSRIARILYRFNQSSLRTRSEEIQAWYAIQALAKLKDPQGLEALFTASRGWYSPQSRVKEEAQKTIGLLEGDLSQGYIDLIVWSLDFRLKNQILDVITKEDFPAAQKAKAGLAALEQGLKWQPGNEEEDGALRTLRTQSLTLLLTLKDKSAEAVPLAVRALTTRPDWTQESTALLLLGVNGTNEAVQVLSNLLFNLIERNKGGALSNADLDRLKTTITALGSSGNPAASEALKAVEFGNFTPAIVRSAKTAREALP